jgi:excisionase family DNA binding protein
MNNRFLQISRVADLLDVSETTTRRLVKKGVLPAIRVGRQIRIDERRLEEWLATGGQGFGKAVARSVAIRSHLPETMGGG